MTMYKEDWEEMKAHKSAELEQIKKAVEVTEAMLSAIDAKAAIAKAKPAKEKTSAKPEDKPET